MASVVIVENGESRAEEIAAHTTGLDLFGNDPQVVAVYVNGQVTDLQLELPDGASISPVMMDSEDGLAVVRHSAAHVTAQALQNLFAEAKLGIGPPITDGFYYDFQVDPLTPEDLKAIEKKMAQIIKDKQRFVRRVVSDAEAQTELAGEPFKLELINDKGSASANDGSSVEVGGAELTIYDNVRKDGTVAWKDLCRGPHVPHTGYIKAVALMKSSAAYWRGDQSKAGLQRVYGTAWATKDDLKAYRTRLEEAAKRDHRKLGAELDLYSFPEEIGPGLVVFHPKGGIVRMEMEKYVRERHLEAGFEFVKTPVISKGDLFHTSGHLPYYADTMFPPMTADEARDESGEITHAGQDYYLKAMNCPMHNLIYRSRGRSYRDLPLRLFEFGEVYRYEKSGVVQGLTRMRGFTQDDSHTYCTPEQAKDEIAVQINFILSLLRDFGLNDFYMELSTRDENSSKFIGSDEAWEQATAILEEAALSTGLDLVPDPGGAAFYGPKVSVQAKDAIGRTWQMSTVQYDFNQPERFDLEYTASDGSHQRPIMIHSAKFGSIERFMGLLVENYAGAFPAWLAPVQVKGVPVASEFNAYLEQFADRLKARGIRVELDESDDRFPKKIRNATKEKVPFIIIVGGEDRDANTVSFRFRDASQLNGVCQDEAIEIIERWVATRNNTDPSADLVSVTAEDA